MREIINQNLKTCFAALLGLFFMGMIYGVFRAGESALILGDLYIQVKDNFFTTSPYLFVIYYFLLAIGLVLFLRKNNEKS